MRKPMTRFRIAPPGLVEFAQRFTLPKPNIRILKPDSVGEYPLISHIMQDSLEKKELRRKLVLPNLMGDGNQTVSVFSDYSGETAGEYNVYSTLVCGWNHSWSLRDQMNKIRKKYGVGKREISFKEFRYGPILRCLKDYLEALDWFAVGMLFSLVVHKDVGTLFGLPSDNAERGLQGILLDAGLGQWKEATAEKLLRVCHIAAFLTSLLSRSGHKIFWMTDHDDIAPNGNGHKIALDVFQRVLMLYSDKQYELIGGALPFSVRDCYTMDLLSATDIVSSSLCHYLSRRDAMGDDVTVKAGVDQVLQWLGHDGLGLKKMVVVVRREGQNEVRFGEMEITPLQLPEELMVVPLVV